MNITGRIGRTAVTGLMVAGIGLGLFGGAAHAEQNTGGNPGGGGKATCLYASKEYKEGETVKQDDGITYKCSDRGTWVLSLVAPPVKDRGQIGRAPTGGVFQALP